MKKSISHKVKMKMLQTRIERLQGEVRIYGGCGYTEIKWKKFESFQELKEFVLYVNSISGFRNYKTKFLNSFLKFLERDDFDNQILQEVQNLIEIESVMKSLKIMDEHQELVDIMLGKISIAYKAVLQHNKQMPAKNTKCGTWQPKWEELSSKRKIEKFLSKVSFNVQFSKNYKVEIFSLREVLNSCHYSDEIIQEAWNLFIIRQVNNS